MTCKTLNLYSITPATGRALKSLRLNILDFKFYQVLGYLHVHNEISRKWDPCLNTKFIYVPNTIYIIQTNTQNLKEKFHSIFISSLLDKCS